MIASIAYWVRHLVELLLYPFDQLSTTGSLLAMTVITSVLMLAVVARVTPQKRIEVARRRIDASIYEMRLFIDSPRRIFAAQGGMLKATGVYLVCLLPAAVVLTIPLGLLYLSLDARYSIAPAAAGEPLVVDVSYDGDFDGYDIDVGPLPAGLAVTAPPVVDAERHRVSIRVDVHDAGSYELPIRAGDHQIDKRIDARATASGVSPTRRRGLGVLWVAGAERPIDGGSPVSEITARYVSAGNSWLYMPWWLFWLVASTVLALALRRPMRVAL